MNTSRVVKHLNWLRGSAFVFAVAAACVMFGATTARAGCGALGNQVQGKPASFAAQQQAHDSVVGFWHVKLTHDDGSLFFQSVVQYHSDGMEMESADRPTYAGNFCMGVWKQEEHTVKIYHIAWLYNNGNPIEYGVFTETNILSNDGNSFRGQYDLKEYDSLTGAFLGEDKGTTVAHRIDFDHPFNLF